MKRAVQWLLVVLLALVDCAGIGILITSVASAPAANSMELPTSTAAPLGIGPFFSYSFYSQPDWKDLSSAVMFEADLDQNGVAEPVSFKLRPENIYGAALTWGESTINLKYGEFIQADVVDMDLVSPFYNLLVLFDYGSDSYVTVELHPENGQLVKGAVLNGSWRPGDNVIWLYEIMNFLGTAFGERTYSGDDLQPDSEWLTMRNIPTAEELETEWEDLVEYGTLLHTILPVPCTVDGQPASIPEDSYLYRLRYRDDQELIEVALLDGTVAQIACDVGEGWWPYLIDGRDMSDYFDNLFFAD